MNNFKNTIMLIPLILLMLFSFGCCPNCQSSQKSLTIVCFGDSLTVCGGQGGRYSDWLSEWLPQHTIINKGIGGDTLEKGRLRFQKDVLDLRPDIVIIELGANDMWRMKRNIHQIRGDLEYMAKQARQNNIEVVIASCFGRRDYEKEKKVEFDLKHQKFATQIWLAEEEICKEYACFYVPNMQIDIRPNGTEPYWDDRNHPNKEGNRLVAKQIMKGLKKAIKAKRENPISIYSTVNLTGQAEL